MVSIPCNFISFSSCLPKKLPLFNKPKTPFFPCPSQIKPKTHFLNAINNSNHSTSQPNNSQEQQLRTLFPGGFKRPEIKIPTVVLKVSDEEVLRKDDGCVVDAVSVGVSKGVGIVVLESSGESGDEGGGRLYDAACVLKNVVGDRAYLLIRDRVDVASAVGASGVLLSDEGLPPIVARNMMMISKSDTVYLPLVARIVKTINSAVNATSSEGADFLIIGNARENFASVLGNAVKNNVKVPIFFSIVDSFGGDLPITFVWKLLESGAPGIVMSTDNLKLFGDEVLKKIFSTAHAVIRIQQDGNLNSRSSELEVVRDMLIEKKGIAGFAKLDDKEIQLIESERLLLREAASVIQEAAPMMKEVGLLEDAISRLSEPFLLVIVSNTDTSLPLKLDWPAGQTCPEITRISLEYV